MPPEPTPATSNRVTVVSTNPETLDGLVPYLRRVGFDVDGAPELGPVSNVGAFVVFWDDFPDEALLSRVAHNGASTILVTRHPKKTRASVEGIPLEARPLIVPCPIWGFTIVEALRSRRVRGRR